MSSFPRPFAVVVVLALASGCQELPSISDLRLPFSDPEEQVVQNVKAALSGKEGHSRLVGDYIAVRRGLSYYVVEGVGLVTGLDGTGWDDGPPYRELMLEDMRKRRFPRPEEFLRSKTTAIVLVRVFIPPLTKRGDRLDVEVYVPEGSGTTSLRGGTLLECPLTEVAYAPGRGRLQGKVLAKAKGPILDAQVTSAELNAPFLRGQIPGGAVYVGEDRDLSIALQREYANYRMSTRIAKRIGERFYDYDDAGIQRPLAEAKTHSRIDLKVHSRYLDNYPRYLQAIRHIHLSDTPVERNLRMQELAEQLAVGPTAARAAIQLEAIGREAVPYLKTGLKADSLEARFYAAEALAYLGDASGAKVLQEAAEREPAFRVFALAALSATMSPEAVTALLPLLHQESIETRYGAFRALTNIAPNEPSVAPLKIKGEYSLHVIDSQAPPVVHLTQRRKMEVVIFGAEQRLQTPVMLRAGHYILVRSQPTGDRLTVTFIPPGSPEQRREVSTRLVDLLLAMDEFGAQYPDVVQMLIEADRQGNLVGKLAIDELPRAGRVYVRPNTDGRQDHPAESQIGGAGDVPNLFDASDHTQGAVEGPIDPDDPPPADNLGPVGFTVN